MRACWFPSFWRAGCWFQDTKSSIRPYSNFRRLVFSAKTSESHAMLGILQPGEIEECWPEKYAGNLTGHVNNFLGALNFAFGTMDRESNRCNLKVSPVDQSALFVWNQRGQGISACCCDVSDSRNPLLEPWIAGWLRIRQI